MKMISPKNLSGQQSPVSYSDNTPNHPYIPQDKLQDLQSCQPMLGDHNNSIQFESNSKFLTMGEIEIEP